MDLPLVSVIVPNYNHEQFLHQRLDTILDQTYQNFELILLDDASTDGSRDILVEYAQNPKVSQLIVNTSNSGSLFKQWIKGIQLAKGDFIWIAESDDYSDSAFLDQTIQKFIKNPQVGLVFTDSNIVDQSDQIIGQTSKSNTILSEFKKTDQRVIKKGEGFSYYFISNLLIWNASSVLFSKKGLELVDFNVLENLKNAGDLFTYISIGLELDVVYIDEPLNFFRSHGENTTKKNILSGELFRDRMLVMTYFVEHDKMSIKSKYDLNNFLKRNFLTAIDFNCFKEVQRLLKGFKKKELISANTYSKLNRYVQMVRIFGKKLPQRFRMNIKHVLNSLVADS